MAVQVIAEYGRAQRGVLAAPAVQPAQGGVEFAILFVKAVLGADKFRCQ